MNWGLDKWGSGALQDLSLDFSKMSSTTLFSIALLGVLVILLIVLVIVTIKVLSKGKKEDRENYTERTYTTPDEDAEDEGKKDDADQDDENEPEEEEDFDSGKSKKHKKDKKQEKKEKKKAKELEKEKRRSEYESGDGDDDEDEEDSESETTVLYEKAAERKESREDVAAVVEAALQAKAKAAELEARVAREKAEQAAKEAEEAKEAKEAKEAEAASEDEEAEDTDEDGDDFGRTDEIPVARIRHELENQEEADILKARTQIADSEQIVEAVKAARSGKKAEAGADSAFGEKAFDVEEENKKTLDTTFDSAFTDPNLRQEYPETEGEKTEEPIDSFEDSAFGSPADEDSAGAEEEVHSLQVAGETITVNPVNAVNILTVNADGPVQTTNPEAGINDPSEMSDFLTDNPVPKKEKKKLKKKDVIFAKKFDEDMPHIQGGRFLWYNNQDIEALTKKEDMYFYCHYFDDPEEAILPLIIEMYDCAFVRTEEIQKIAYGINYRSMGLREILTSKEDVSFDRSKIVKEPTEQDLLQIRAKWVDYVDNFLQIIVIKAPGHMQEYIREQLYAYGENDVETLLFCPELEEEEE